MFRDIVIYKWSFFSKFSKKATETFELTLLGRKRENILRTETIWSENSNECRL